MTVQDLIEYLTKLPHKDKTQVGVVFRQFSGISILEECDMEFRGKAEWDAIDQKRREGRHLWGDERKRYVLRHGKLMEYNEQTWPKNETPEFVPVLILPGN